MRERLTSDVVWAPWVSSTAGGVWVAGSVGRLRERAGGGGEGAARHCGEGLWVCGVLGHERLVMNGGVTELGQQAVLRVELAVSRHEDWWQHWQGRQRGHWFGLQEAERWCNAPRSHTVSNFVPVILENNVS